MLAARELYERGVASLERGRLADAARALRTALARTDDAELRARILLSLAYHEAERGRVADGLSLLDAADSDDELPTELRALVASQRGLLLMRAGDVDAALGQFTSALDDLRDPAAVARAAINRGNVFLQRRDLRRAGSDFAHCVEVAEQHDMPLLAAKARHNLGYVELLAGNLPAALRQMARAGAELAGTAPAVAAVCDYDRAQALAAAGLGTEAESVLAEAAEVLGRHRLRQSQAEAELLRAQLALASGRTGDALRVGRRAAARFRRRGSGSWALRADATVLAAQVGSGRERPSVLRTGPGLAAELDMVGLRDEGRTVRLHLARALLAAGRTDEARAAAGAVRTPATAPVTTRLLDRATRADLATARGRPADAAGHLRRGLAELFAWQSSFGSLDLQTGVAGHGRALAVRGLEAAVADGRPDVVFDWSERARAMASRVPPVRPPADADAAAELEELRALRAEPVGSLGPAAGRRIAELERRVRDHARYPAGPGIGIEPLALDDVRSRVSAEDGAMVSHLVVSGRVHALVATARGVSVHPLGPYTRVGDVLGRVSADLDAAATRLPAALRAAIGGSLASGCAELGAALLDPLPLGDGPVLLVPSAALTAVPWTLLPALAGRPVALARTATSWAMNRRPGETVSTVGLVAGPHVDRADEEVSSAAAAWPRLDQADAVLSGTAATAAAVTALASRVDLLHVAAHGTHSVDNPLFSGLELVDGPWFGHDVAAVDPVPAHVVLSACELGRATVRSGEETLGMTAAWQHAGARTVVASPVRVNDDTACQVLASHHRRLARGDRPAVALAAAVAALPPDAAPAPLVCFGAGW